MLKLRKEAERVYSLSFDNRKELCLCFLRYQEFYESDNHRFQNRTFTWAEYITWYAKKRGSFSYAEDWSGFNFPANTIRVVQKLGIPDPNHYDRLMDGLLGLIEGEAETSDCYLIGFQTGHATTLDHEMAHAAYYLDETYRYEVESLVLALPENLGESLSTAIQTLGYAKSSVLDEIQAFALTGSRKLLWKGRTPRPLAKFYVELEKLYARHQLTRL